MEGFFENREWFAAAAAIFFAAFACGCVSVARSRGGERSRGLRSGGIFLTALGWATLSFALFFRGSASGELPVSNFFEIFQTLGWFAVFFVVLLRSVWALRVPVFFGAGAAALLCAAGFANVGLWDAAVVSPSDFLAGTPWIGVHAGFATVGYACFSAAGIVWCVYLIQNSALRRGCAHPFFARLPDLASLDRIAGRLCSAGLVIFGAGTAIGSAILLGGGRLGNALAAYKTAFSAALFFGFLTLVLLRRRNRISALKCARIGVALVVVGLAFLGGTACVKSATDGGVPAALRLEDGRKERR